MNKDTIKAILSFLPPYQVVHLSRVSKEWYTSIRELLALRGEVDIKRGKESYKITVVKGIRPRKKLCWHIEYNHISKEDLNSMLSIMTYILNNHTISLGCALGETLFNGKMKIWHHIQGGIRMGVWWGEKHARVYDTYLVMKIIGMIIWMIRRYAEEADSGENRIRGNIYGDLKKNLAQHQECFDNAKRQKEGVYQEMHMGTLFNTMKNFYVYLHKITKDMQKVFEEFCKVFCSKEELGEARMLIKTECEKVMSSGDSATYYVVDKWKRGTLAFYEYNIWLVPGTHNIYYKHGDYKDMISLRDMGNIVFRVIDGILGAIARILKNHGLN
jgi:hypothetical protein